MESVGEGGGLEEMKIELSLNWICRLLGAAWQYCLDLILMRLRVRRDGLHLVDKWLEYSASVKQHFAEIQYPFPCPHIPICNMPGHSERFGTRTPSYYDSFILWLLYIMTVQHSTWHDQDNGSKCINYRVQRSLAQWT